jgi:hypothetical protein
LVADGSSEPIVLSKSLPADAGAPLLESFAAYSIEFSSFPDFAGENAVILFRHSAKAQCSQGMIHSLTKFSDNLLNNIRAGGNTHVKAIHVSGTRPCIVCLEI